MANIVVEATGAAIPAATLLGYQAEGARTNRCLHSQAFSNAAWVSGGGGISVADNSIAAPDGTTTADTLTASGANGTLIQDLGVVASAAKAGGLWLKRKTGTGNVDLTLDGGATWTTVAVTSAWLRLEKTQTLADEDFGIRIVTSGDAVYAWQGQVETAAFLSSDTPTTTAAVTRNADALAYQLAGNMSNTVGASYAELHNISRDPLGHNMAIADSAGTGGVCLYFGQVNGKVQMYDGVTVVEHATVPTFPVASIKMASSWQTTQRLTWDGKAVSSGTFDGNMNVTAIQVGDWGAGYGLFGTIKQARIWTTPLTDAQLVTITTP